MHADSLTPSARAAVERVNRLAYSPDEVADALGLSKQTVYNLINDGRLPSFKVGRSRRIWATAVEALDTGKVAGSPRDAA